VNQNDKTAISELQLLVFLFQYHVFGLSNQRRSHGIRIKPTTFFAVIRRSRYNAIAYCAFDASKISGFEFKVVLICDDESTLQTVKSGSENASAFFVFQVKLIFANLCLKNRFV